MIDNWNRLKWAETLAEDHPMSPILKAVIADAIEPHTQNCRIDHDEVMEAIDMVYPLIVADVMKELALSVHGLSTAVAPWLSLPPMPPPDGVDDGEE